jgi:cyclic pyranopterin phosphate synthase
MLARGALPKGDALPMARAAGILAAKKTPDLIPLCHPIAITSVEIAFEVDAAAGRVEILATAGAADRTGVEMEALTAASVAALTIYDMCKSVQKDIEIASIVLLEKTGGKSGPYKRNG